jgi:transcriptional regulator with XRE-family HTH domain
MNYGKALRLARALANINQKELASEAGLDPSHVSLIEKGTRRPSLATLEKLSSALQIPNDLFVLLAAEKNDLKLRDSEELKRASESLARLLIQYEPPEPATTPKRRRSQKT